MSMPDQQDPNSFLMGSGFTSFKFDSHGDVAKGEIVSLDLMQQRDYKSGLPKFWDDGRPMMQLRVVLDTGIIDPGIEGDDGVRAIYVRGAMQQAVRDAIKKAGVKEIEVGGTLAVAYVGDGEAKPKMDPPKLFRAEYRPPAPKTSAPVSADDLI
jgi:hypothetical protein